MKYSYERLLVFAVALAAFAAPGVAADYSLDLKPDSTSVHFSVDSTLHTVHGKFALKRGRIDFNTETGKASGQVVVDVASGNSDSDARDSRMHSVVLESKKYPEAVFSPDRIDGAVSMTGASSVKVHGTFTIHGATHEVTMEAQTAVSGDQIHATLSFDVPYVEWGMKDPGNFMLKVNKVVKMTIETSAPLSRK